MGQTMVLHPKSCLFSTLPFTGRTSVQGKRGGHMCGCHWKKKKTAGHSKTLPCWCRQKKCSQCIRTHLFLCLPQQSWNNTCTTVPWNLQWDTYINTHTVMTTCKTERGVCVCVCTIFYARPSKQHMVESWRFRLMSDLWIYPHFVIRTHINIIPSLESSHPSPIHLHLSIQTECCLANKIILRYVHLSVCIMCAQYCVCTWSVWVADVCTDCVCVCVRERERERASEWVQVHVF